MVLLQYQNQIVKVFLRIFFKIVVRQLNHLTIQQST